MPSIIITSPAQAARVEELRRSPFYWSIGRTDWEVDTEHMVSARLYSELMRYATAGPRKLIKWWEVDEANLPLDISAEM